MSSFRFSLRFVILSALASLLLLTWILLSLISFKTAEQNLIAQKNQQSRQILTGVLSLLGSPLPDAERISAARRFSEALAAERDFAGLVVVDANGATIFSTGGISSDRRLGETMATGKESFRLFTNGTFIKYLPWQEKGKVVGAAKLTISLHGDYERLSRSRQLFVTYFILDFLVILVLGSYILSRLIVHPIRRLLDATERISAGDLQHRVHAAGTQEMAELADAYNTMLAALKSKQEAVEKHLQALQEANRDLRQAREETIRSEKLASVGLLAAGMAHEIGTPLAAIIGYAGLLREELKDDPGKSDFIDRLEQDAQRIDRLVRDLLDYARPKDSMLEPADLHELLNVTLEWLKGQGISKKIDVSLSVASDLPLVSVDKHQMEQVFINLIINARDAMPEGGGIEIVAEPSLPPLHQKQGEQQQDRLFGRRSGDFRHLPHAPLQSADHGRWVKVEVRDQGTGIPAEHLSRIFDPFFTTKEPGKGTGLGLSICSRIIDSFGGRIFVASEPGRGTVFTLYLPALEGKSA